MDLSMQFQDKIQSFYDNYIIRDFYGYVLPGLIILGSMFYLFPIYELINNFFNIVEWWEYLFFGIALYIISFVCGMTITTISYYFVFRILSYGSLKWFILSEISYDLKEKLTKHAINKYLGINLDKKVKDIDEKGICIKKMHFFTKIRISKILKKYFSLSHSSLMNVLKSIKKNTKEYDSQYVEYFCSLDRVSMYIISEGIINSMYECPIAKIKYLRINSLTIMIRNLTVVFFMTTLILLFKEFEWGYAIISFFCFCMCLYRGYKFKFFVSRDMCVHMIKEMRNYNNPMGLNNDIAKYSI